MAIKLNAPIGEAKWGPFFIRMALGGYFILAGYSKFRNLNAFVEQVQQFGILPPDVGMLYGVTLPYAEVAAGALIFFGYWTTLGAILATMMLGSFVYAIGVFPGETKLLFNKDLILLGAALSLLYSGAGAYSVDRFRSSGG